MLVRNRITLFLLSLLSLAILLFPSSGHAEVKEIIAEGTYCMGDGETPLVASDRALLAAKRTALEQAGTYVESYSSTRNFSLTADEVKVIASGIMEVAVLDKHRTVDGNSIIFWVKIKAMVTTDKIEDMAAKIKDLSLAADYKKLQESYDKSQKEIAALKQQLAQADTDGEKRRIRSEISESEMTFQANTWFEQGNQKMADGKYPEAINAYTEAINLNPRFGPAYLRRGVAYAHSGEYRQAITDLTRALDSNPQLTLAYLKEGQVYEKLRERQAAIDAYRQFLEYAAPDQQPYINFARHRLRVLEEAGATYFSPPDSGPPGPGRVIIYRRRGPY
ncbi:MAG: tetratricopeptide repeat protein [Negativicutes bacterium]|nr:tetratricopeptide repeat protein [Negativicutes bacterium]